MFKSWSKKNKIKAIFKLQFHVTQVPKLKKSAVMISLVPEDAGKPSVKLEKVAVQDGTCTWENPVYEPVKLTMDSKTGKINEKLYHFIVSTGASKSGYLGEASIDFSDFATETEPLTVSMPLKFANSGAILHVLIQRMLGDDERDENGAPQLVKNGSLDSNGSNWDADGTSLNYTDENYDNMNPAEQDATNFLSPFITKPVPQKGRVNATETKKRSLNRSNMNWSADSASDDSLLESPSSLEDSHPSLRLKEASDDSIEKLKYEITILMRQAELSELEIQSLRKHVEKETKQGQNLSRQIVSLKEERDALKSECEQFKTLRRSTDEAEAPKRLQASIKDSRVQLEAMRQELNHEKELSNDLHLQLQKTQDSNADLMLVVRDLEDTLEQKNREVLDLSGKIETAKNATGVDQQSSESLGKRHNDAEVDLLEAKIGDLCDEIDIFKEEREKQNKRINQLILNNDLLKQDNYDMSLKLKRSQEEQTKLENECAYYIATTEEHESQVERLENTIKKQAREFADTLVSINELEMQVKALEKELEKQAKRFEDELDAIKRAKVEQEQRANQAEEALRNTRLSGSNKAEHLQEEFRRQANELRQNNIILEEKLQKVTKELGLTRDQEKVKLQEFVDRIDLKEKQIEKMSLELNNKSQQLECAQNLKEEKHETFTREIKKLRAEIERLNMEKSNLAEEKDERVRLKNETERMKKSASENEMLVKRLNKEKENLEAKLALAKQEAEKESKTSSCASERNISDLLTEVASLKDKSKSMEKELKEMEGRYSELSLRFAEVEGERQQLVMTVRNLKNGKKN